MTIFIRQSPMMVDQNTNLSIGRQHERGSFACCFSHWYYFTSCTRDSRTDGRTSEKFVSRDFELHRSLFVLTYHQERNGDEAHGHLSVQSVCRCLTSYCWQLHYTDSMLVSVFHNWFECQDSSCCGQRTTRCRVPNVLLEYCARLERWQLLQKLVVPGTRSSSIFQLVAGNFSITPEFNNLNSLQDASIDKQETKETQASDARDGIVGRR